MLGGMALGIGTSHKYPCHTKGAHMGCQQQFEVTDIGMLLPYSCICDGKAIHKSPTINIHDD